MDFQIEIQDRIDKLMSVIPHCKTRKEAEGVQDEIYELELMQSACPSCGDSYHNED